MRSIQDDARIADFSVVVEQLSLNQLSGEGSRRRKHIILDNLEFIGCKSDR